MILAPLSKIWSTEKGEVVKHVNKQTNKQKSRNLLQLCTIIEEEFVNFSEIEHRSGSHNTHILVYKQAIN